MEPGYEPADLFEGVFEELPASPPFPEVIEARFAEPYPGSLEQFARHLLSTVHVSLAHIEGPIHVLLSGGYDSRMIACILERLDKKPLYITDGMEEPSCGQILDLLGVPWERIYRHPMDGPDPYGLAEATCDGFAPLYQQLRFMPGDPEATLVTGLGGGEWFSYPASGWLNGKHRRLPGDDVVGMWLDCWPQYTLIHKAWARGYREASHPYCTVDYAKVAARCRPEWLQETPGNPPLDLVRGAMLAQLEERLLGPPWMPHVYPWNLSEEQKERIDDRFFESWVSDYYKDEYGLPSQMDDAPFACTLAGFATWVDKLTTEGFVIVRP